jgi:Ca2+-binding RTX toxin-like protein
VRWDNEGAPTTITDYEARERLELEIPAIFDDTELTITPDESGENTLINVGDQTAIILEGVTDPDTVNITLFGREIVQTPDDESDLIAGTDGDDTIDTGFGQDIAYGGAGNDMLDGGRETDVLYGGSGDDVIAGNGGDDLINGGAGDDLIKAGAGNDIVVDRDGNDTVRGGSEDDLVDVRDLADDGQDVVTLGTGDDAVLADDGDSVKLGAGNDVAIVSVENVTDAPVTFKDFDPAEDILTIAIGDGTGAVTLSPVNNGADTLVTVDGQEVAILARINLTAATNINVTALIPETTP